MTKAPAALTRALRFPGVWKARRVAELAVTPRSRIELERLELARGTLETQIDHVRRSVADIEASLPAVLNAISSMSGAARLVKRELDAFRGEVDARHGESDAIHQNLAASLESVEEKVAEGDHRVLSEMRPHAETLSWLVQRVETVRFEMLNELRYGRHPDGRTALEPKIVNPSALERSPLRLNVGAGHIPFDGYVNVDMRELPGIDVVATVDDLPFEAGTVDEIFSSHTLEHFPQEFLRRQLLPYWASLLKPGGILTTVAPDLEAMTMDYARRDTPFEDLREVIYGGQEYEGDTHFTGFTPDSFSKLLLEAGFVDPATVADDRKNGQCKEFEITARKAQ